MRKFFVCLLVAVAVGLLAWGSSPSLAQKKGAAAAVSKDDAEDDPSASVEAPRLPDRIARPMIAIDPVTLKAEGIEIRLWGIKPASTSETSLELKALDLLDDIIDGQVVNCKIEGGQVPVLFGRCVVQANSDLSLELLNNGLAIRDRRQTYNTAYASAYGQAEEFARFNNKGVWKYLAEADRQSAIPKWLEPHLELLVPLALVFGPLAGLLSIAFVMWFWLKKMSRTQQQEAEISRRKEATLQTRERNVLLSTLEGELMENKNKIEAFAVIYGDMLRSLKDPNEAPKYQQVGDIVQKHPSFGKTVFEANVNKLSLLGIKLAGQISKLYSSLPKEQEYINLEPDVPLETAIKLVEKVMKEAEELLPPIDAAIQSLQAAQQRQE
jgi:endonuclease YncB( thermonuclease family)